MAHRHLPNGILLVSVKVNSVQSNNLSYYSTHDILWASYGKKRL